MDNSGDGPLRVPGFAPDLPQDFCLPPDAAAFTCRSIDWRQDPRLTARELAMLDLMERLTDLPDWTTKVFDETTLADFKANEQRTNRLMSDRVWAWCLAELRDKATAALETGFVLALDSGSRVAKADGVVPAHVAERLSGEADRLADVIELELEGVTLVRTEEDKWEHPSMRAHLSDKAPGVVTMPMLKQHLIDPMLYPLVHGRSTVLANGRRVDLDDVCASCGSGTVAPEPDWKGIDTAEMLAGWRSKKEEVRRAHQWSRRFQRLPCEYRFTGSHSDPVGEITSYINGVHPSHFRGLYECVGSIIGLAVPVWNEVLVLNGKHRSPVRIRTYGADPREFPEWMGPMVKEKLGEGQNWREKCPGLEEKVNAYLALPDMGPWVVDKRHDVKERDSYELGADWEKRMTVWDAIWVKYLRIGRYLHPEPGVSFTYEDWKAGRTAAAAIPKESSDLFQPGADHEHKYYTVSLQDKFRADGLQVIVSMTTIDLTQEDAFVNEEEWCCQGLSNDRVVATAIYFLDVENMSSDTRLCFQQDTELGLRQDRDYDQDAHSGLAAVFDIDEAEHHGWEPSVQKLGSVAPRPGRLVAFPNTLESKFESVVIGDEERPGRLRWLTLELVDPHYRVCSTRNVPPQQHSWWAEAALAQVDWVERGLPAELVVDIAGRLDEQWPMGRGEAERLREEFRRDKALYDVLCEDEHGYVWQYTGNW